MILVIAETQDRKIKKSALEAVTLGAKAAASRGVACNALLLGTAGDGARLGQYGAGEVWHLSDSVLDKFDSQVYARVIAKVAEEKQASTVILPDSANGRSLIGMLAIFLKAGVVRGANRVPEWVDGQWEVGRAVFSGKATATCRILSEKAVISVAGNTLKPTVTGSDATVTALSVEIPTSSTRVREVRRSTGIVPLPEAEVVVSAGRGMKDPSNWGIV